VAKKRFRDQRGVAVVEMAFVALIMLTLVAGAVDYGLGWRSGLVMTEAARTGARVGSGQANSRSADYNAMSGLRAALTASGKLDDVEQVIVFEATAGGTVPTACKNGTGGTCIVYTGNQFRALNDRTSWNLVWPADPQADATGGDGCPRVATRAAWCPTSRNNTQLSAQYYGVYIKYRHDHLFTFLLGSHTTVERTAIMRLEPPSM
jgi:hypothetical protein